MASSFKSFVDNEGRECVTCGVYKKWADFNTARKETTGHWSTCKECIAKKRCRKKQKDKDLRRHYGISLTEYNQMLDDQHHGCKICGKDKQQNGRDLAVDHCHSTGKVRGLLCNNCNRALGYFEDDQNRMRLAMQYLDDATAA